MMKPFSGNPLADAVTAPPLKKIGACEFGPGALTPGRRSGPR